MSTTLSEPTYRQDPTQVAPGTIQNARPERR